MMDENVPVCKVMVVNDSTSNHVYAFTKEFNIAELNAVKISNKIYIDSRYLDVIAMVFDYDNKILQIHVDY